MLEAALPVGSPCHLTRFRIHKFYAIEIQHHLVGMQHSMPCFSISLDSLQMTQIHSMKRILGQGMSISLYVAPRSADGKEEVRCEKQKTWLDNFQERNPKECKVQALNVLRKNRELKNQHRGKWHGHTFHGEKWQRLQKTINQTALRRGIKHKHWTTVFTLASWSCKGCALQFIPFSLIGNNLRRSKYM